MGKYESKLAEMGITLAQVPTPVANYLPYAITGNLVFLAGQVCRVDGKVTHQGKLGAEIDVAGGKAAARVCAPRGVVVLPNGELIVASGSHTLHPALLRFCTFLRYALCARARANLRLLPAATAHCPPPTAYARPPLPKKEPAMTLSSGIHHITAIAGDARRNVDFYTRVLGLRLIKKTVNFDDPGTYHL